MCLGVRAAGIDRPDEWAAIMDARTGPPRTDAEPRTIEQAAATHGQDGARVGRDSAPHGKAQLP